MKFEAPEIKIAQFSAEEILTASSASSANPWEEPTGDCPARGDQIL